MFQMDVQTDNIINIKPVTVPGYAQPYHLLDLQILKISLQVMLFQYSQTHQILQYSNHLQIQHILLGPMQ